MKIKSQHVTVCICTYKRPHMLARLIKELQYQRTDKEFTYSALIVDNDAVRSASQAIDVIKKGVNFHISYYWESQQNIALARNKAVQNAAGDILALIDDDEIPHREWLLNLYKSFQKYQVDGVLGPVIPLYEVDPPEWIVKGRFYDRPSLETGTVLDWTNTRTGNVLLKKSIFKAPDRLFRKEFGSGGEDRDFFRRMINKGYRFVWTAEAPVYEVVPPERLTKSFMIRRALLRGKRPYLRPSDIIKSVVAIPIYTFMLPFLFFRGQHIFMKYLIKDFDHLGKVLAVCGFKVIKQKYIMK